MRLFLMKSTIIVGVILTLIFPQISFSQVTYTWIGNTNNSWDTPSNWNPSGIPNTQDKIIIGNITNPIIIQTNKSVKEINTTSGAKIEFQNNSTLTISSLANITGLTTTSIGLTNLTIGSVSSPATSVNIINSNLSPQLNITSGSTNLTSNIFQSKVTVNKIGASTYDQSVGNTYQQDLEWKHTAGNQNVYLNFGNASTIDTYQGDVILSKAANIANNSFYIGSNGANTNISAGKTIKIGNEGFLSGGLYIYRLNELNLDLTSFNNFTNSSFYICNFTQANANAITFNFANNVNLGFVDSNIKGIVNITSGSTALSRNTFQSNVIINKIGGRDNDCTAGNIFQQDLEWKHTSGEKHIHLNYASGNSDIFLGNIILSKAANLPSNNFYFGANGANTNISAGKTIKIGNEGFLSGGLYIYRLNELNLDLTSFNNFTNSTFYISNFTQASTNAITFNFANNVNFGFVDSNIKGIVNITSGSTNLSRNTFQSNVIINKIGSRDHDYSYRNIFQQDLEWKHQAGDKHVRLNWGDLSNPDTYLGNIILTKAANLNAKTHIGENGANTNISDGKLIKIGTEGFLSSELIIYRLNNLNFDLNSLSNISNSTISIFNFVQNNTNPITFNFPDNVTFRFAGSNIKGIVNITSGSTDLSNNTFQSNVIINKIGGRDHDYTSGNIFQQDLEWKHTAGEKHIYLNYSDATTDIFLGNIILSKAANLLFNNFYFGTYGATTNISAGKTIKIGNEGFLSGGLYINKLNQSSPLNLKLGKFTILNLTNSILQGNTSIEAGTTKITGCILDNEVRVTKMSTSSYDSEVNNTFNKDLTWYNKTTHPIFLNYNGIASKYFGNIILSKDLNTGAFQIGANGGNITNLKANKTIKIGNEGFLDNALSIYNLTQDTPDSLVFELPALASLNLYNSQIKGGVRIVSGSGQISSCTFNENFSITKTGSSNITFSGINTFNKNISLDNKTALGSILISNSNADIFKGDIKFDGIGAISFANFASNYNLQGNITVNNNQLQFGTTNANCSFTLNGTNNQFINGTNTNLSINKLIINNNAGIDLKTNLLITNNLNLVSGVITTSSNGQITISNVSTLIGGSSNAFIACPLIKNGNNVFTAHIGKGNSYSPVIITPISNTTTSDSYKFEYFNKSADALNISNCEYWQIDKIQGNATVKVLFNWKNCNLGDPNNCISLVKKDISNWLDLGKNDFTVNNISTTGTISTGNINASNLGIISIATKNGISFNLASKICKDGITEQLQLEGIPTGGIFTENSNTISNNVLALNISGERKIKYTVTANGCTNSLEKTTVIYSKPAINWGEIPESVCISNNPILLNILPNNGILSGQNISGNQFLPSQEGLFTMNYQLAFGDGCIASYTKQINVSKTSTLSVKLNINSNGKVCEGLPTFIKSECTVNDVNFNWYKNSELIDNNNQVIILNGLKNNDVIKCKVTLKNLDDACNGVYDTEDSKVIILSPLEDSKVQISTNTQLPVPNNTNTSFAANPVNLSGNLLYKWKKNGIYIENNTSNFTTNINEYDEVQCIVIPQDGQCVLKNPLTSNIIINRPDVHYYDLSLSLIEAPVVKKLGIGYLYFKFEEKYNSGNLKFNVYNNQKSKVLTNLDQSINKKVGDNFIRLDVSSLQSGSYILEVFSENNEIKYLKFN